ncbi:hypothetical protein B0A48_03390 [Cryoendolithus antarcticus]|uniref:BTB domain-containing protein n=1 Tax=Cryoendolithus antarcticus TaxID=1507870 RepID=A0A1V8TJV4_9PEZI|nr:hypothetical protein B0A48_03390 [Cryoendolithus antarcticus]
MTSATEREQSQSVFGAVSMGSQNGFTSFGSQDDTTPKVVMPTPPMIAETAKGAFEKWISSNGQTVAPGTRSVGKPNRAQSILQRLFDDDLSKDITLEASDEKVFTAHKSIIFQSSDWMKSKWEAEKTLKLDCPADVIEPLLRHAYGLYVGLLHDSLPASTSEATQGSDAEQDSVAVQNIEAVQQLLAAASKYCMKDFTTAAIQRLLQLLDCCDDRPGLIVTVASSIYNSDSDEKTRRHAAKAVVRVLQDVMSEEKNEATLMANVKLARDVMFFAGQNLKATTASMRAPKYDFGASVAEGKERDSSWRSIHLPPPEPLSQLGTAANHGFRVATPAAEPDSMDYRFSPRECVPGPQFGQLQTSVSYTPPAFWGRNGPVLFGISQQATSAPPKIHRHPLSTAQPSAATIAPQDTYGKPVEEYFGGMSQARLKRLAETDGAEDTENKRPKTDGL